MDYFVLHSEYKPTDDQPEAIKTLVNGFKEGNQFQTFLGCYWLRQDLYDGKCHSGIKQAHPYHRPQQAPCRTVLWGEEGIFSGERSGIVCILSAGRG